LLVAAGQLAGTVTFLLTDIVGSTQVWERDAAAMAAAMVVHDRVIDEAVVRWGRA
jgi:class 3 adenylate cyclase